MDPSKSKLSSSKDVVTPLACGQPKDSDNDKSLPLPAVRSTIQQKPISPPTRPPPPILSLLPQEIGRGQGSVVPAVGPAPLGASSSSIVGRTLSKIKNTPPLRSVKSLSLGKKPPKSPLPAGVFTDGHARQYFSGQPVPPPTPRPIISLSAPKAGDPSIIVSTPPKTTPCQQPTMASSQPLKAEADIPSTIRGDEAGRFAYSAMRGEQYDNLGPLYAQPFVETAPTEKHDHLRLDEHRPGDKGRERETWAHYDGVPSAEVIRADRKPRTKESLYHLAGYNKIRGQFVDPDAIEDVYMAAEGLTPEQKAGLTSINRAPCYSQQDREKQASNDSSISVPHEKINIDGPTFTDLAQGTQKLVRRSSSFVEQMTLGEVGDLELLQGPKPPGKRLAQEDHVYVPPVNEFGSDGWLSDYTADQNPSPKPEGEGQNLAKIPFMLSRNQGRPLMNPEPSVNTTNSATSFNTDNISELELPGGYFQDLQDLGRGRTLHRESSPKRAKSLKRVNKIGPHSEGGGSSLRDEYTSSALDLPAERYEYDFSTRNVDFERGRPTRKRLPSPSPAKSLRRFDKYDPHLQRSGKNLRDQFQARSPSRGRARSCLRGKQSRTQPRLSRSESRVRIVSKGGKMYNPGDEQATSVASDLSKETFESLFRDAAQSFEENIQQQGDERDEHSTTLESDTMNNTFEDDDQAFHTAASIEANLRQGEAQYNQLKATQDKVMEQIDNLKSSISSTISSLQPADRYALKLAEVAAFRSGQVPLRQYRPVLADALLQWHRELNRISTQLGGNVEALEDRRAVTQQHIVQLDKKKKKADEMVDETEAQYHKLRAELAEAQNEMSDPFSPDGESTGIGIQTSQTNSQASVGQESFQNIGTEQQPLSSLASSRNSHSGFAGQPRIAQQQQYNPAQFGQDGHSVEYHGFDGRETSQPRDYRSQPTFGQQQQDRDWNSFQDVAGINQESIRQFEAAANAPGGLFGGALYSGLPRSHSFGGSQRNASYQLHNQYAANPQRGYGDQFNAQQQQYNASGAGQRNLSSQAEFDSDYIGFDTQPFTGQQQYGGFGDSRQNFGYPTGKGQAPFGFNLQAQQYAAQMQHGNFGRDVRGEQGAGYERQYGQGPAYMNQPQEVVPENRYSNQMRRNDSDLSEADVRRMSGTGEYIIQPRRGSRAQPNMAPPVARIPLSRIDEEEAEYYGVQSQSARDPFNSSPPSMMRSSPPPRAEHPRNRHDLPPSICNERGQATLRPDSTTGDGLISLCLSQEHLSSPRRRSPQPPQQIRWAWQLPHNGEYRAPGYENMLTGMALRGQQNNPYRSNVYRPDGSSSSISMAPAQRSSVQMQMPMQHQWQYTRRSQEYEQRTGQPFADPEDDDREIFYTARATVAPRTPERQRARDSMTESLYEDAVGGDEERGW